MAIIAESIKRAIGVAEKLGLETKFYDQLKAQGLYPHSGQKLVLKILFKYKKKRVLLQCGRNFGKSHTLCMAAVLYAIMHPNSRVYIIAPLRAQAYEIYWASGLLKSMIPRDLLIDGEEAYNKSELRIFFRNGSFIKIDGADNEDAMRGIKPHWVGRDERQAWKKEAIESMEPNLLAHNAVCFDIGTPPDRDNHFTKDAKYFEKQMRSGNKNYFYLRQPTSANPRISKEELEQIKRKLIERGEEEIYTREYEAIFVPGGASAIFKMFSKDAHTRPRDWIYSRLLKDFGKCEMWVVCDPGSTTVFAVAFFILNRYTGEVFLVDEIYEKDDKLCSTGQIWPRVLQTEAERFGAHSPIRYYDEAAAWFLNEVCNQFPNNCGMTPTNKKMYERDATFNADSCSVIKDAFNMGKFFIAEECRNAIAEITNYHKNEKGMVATNQPDHLIDCIRYFFHESGWASGRYTIQQIPGYDRSFYTPTDDARRPFCSEEEEQWMPSHSNEIGEVDIEDLIWN
jgi:hypothetical protein